MLMSVQETFLSVMHWPPVSTLRGTTPVPVTKDTLEMDFSAVLVSQLLLVIQVGDIYYYM